MKKSKLFGVTLLLVLNLSLIYSQEVYIYDEFGKKLHFTKKETVKFVSINPTADKGKKEFIKQNLNTCGGNIEEKTPLLYKVTLSSLQNAELLSDFQKEYSDISISSMLTYADSTVQWTSNEIAVKLHPNTNIEEMLRQYSIPYNNIRQIGSDLQTFVVTLTGVEDKSIEYSNLLYESGCVVFAQPLFWREIKKSNSIYPQQWGLSNTGQNNGTIGVDINAHEAWQLSSGKGIKVAVLDDGVDLTHMDLKHNLLPGYDATDTYWGGDDGGFKGADDHGTACAGIIAAEDNDIGIKGVAYNANIIPIRITYEDASGRWIMNDSWTVDGIYNAWNKKNADILSNSWGGGSKSAAVINEFNRALALGRQDKGCVVVFSTGNIAERTEVRATVSYPYTPSPAVVGTARGYSVANPNNTKEYIGTVNISETSATVNTYVYRLYNVLGQFLGWAPCAPENVQFNFKVLSAMDTNAHLQNQIVSSTMTKNVINNIVAENYIVQNGANVTLRAGNAIVLKPGFKASAGSTFRAYVEPYFTCEQYPTMLVPQDADDEMPDYVIKNYRVENTPLETEGAIIENTYFKVYPNPASDHFNVEYSLNKSEDVEIALYDNIGNVVYRLKNKTVHEAGTYTVQLTGIALSSGIYHCVLQIGNRKELQKIIIK